MGLASLRFRASMATRRKIRLFLFPCNERRRRTGIIESLAASWELEDTSLSRDRLTSHSHDYERKGFSTKKAGSNIDIDCDLESSMMVRQVDRKT